MEMKRVKGIPFFLKGEEEGNYIDMMAGVFMMVCFFALILVMASYGSLVDKRLSVNNAIKNYLYIAEQQGGLTSEDVSNLEDILSDYDCTVESVTVNGSTDWVAKGNGNQVPYGDKIVLEVSVSFANPVYEVIGADSGETRGWFGASGIRKTIKYTKKLSSTSRW